VPRGEKERTDESLVLTNCQPIIDWSLFCFWTFLNFDVQKSLRCPKHDQTHVLAYAVIVRKCLAAEFRLFIA
jgi:hypothetical protein